MSLRMDVVESFGSNSKASKKFRALQAGVAGTNKTLAPTPGVVRPPTGSNPPITPFPTDPPVPAPNPVSLFSYASLIFVHVI